MWHKKFVYMQRVDSSHGAASSDPRLSRVDSPDAPSSAVGRGYEYVDSASSEGDSGGQTSEPSRGESNSPFKAENVPEQTLPSDQIGPYDRSVGAGFAKSAYDAIVNGESSAFLKSIIQMRSHGFEYDVDYAEAMLNWFSDYEQGINSLRASMQGFSTDKGDYRLTELEYKTLQAASELLKLVGFGLRDVHIAGGRVVQDLFNAYEESEEADVEISKKNANELLQFLTQMEDKILPSDAKQEVLAAQLEATSKKRDGFYNNVMPNILRNIYGR